MPTIDDPRKILRTILQNNLIGPANELFDTTPNSEIVIGKPLNKYYSAILFPRLDGDILEIPVEHDDEDIYSLINDETNSDDEGSTIEGVLEKEEAKDDDIANTELYPRSLGLTFCLKPEAQEVNCIAKFGTYEEISPKEKSFRTYTIKMSSAEFQKIQSMGSNTGENDIKITDLFQYNESTSRVILKKPLEGTMTGTRTGDFKALDSLWQVLVQRAKECGAEEVETYREKVAIFGKLMAMSRTGWKRVEHIYDNTIKINTLLPNGETRLWLVDGRSNNDKSRLSVFMDVKLVKKDTKYLLIRVVLSNFSTVNLPMYISNNEILNSLSMFQCGMEIKSDDIIPLPAVSSKANQTKENNILDCQYRGRPPFGLAHNCSFEKVIDNGNLVIKSTYLPSVRPDVMTSNMEIDQVNMILAIHRNSSFSRYDNPEIIAGLKILCKAYHDWISRQDNLRNNIQSEFSSIAGEIVDSQRVALERILNGVELLQTNDDLMDCFKLANASMLVNMLITSEGNKLRQDMSLFTTSEFEEYRYRLFQLAFLLLNIKGIVEPDSCDRNELVDILWFPTGGGKTEAYLLLAAFTLIWRRKKHGDSGQGTAIIMRYTLRLLTAQQFERACKIILAMNFVCSNIDPDLVSVNPFSIGLWIGGQSSPNKLRDSGSAEECISKIINQSDLDYAKSINKIPLEACPWCGESLINQNAEGQTITGYRVVRNKFHISCLNASCSFNKALPIDCVDESLYAYPPSLLFATIDKFAQLAWKSETKAFFGRSMGYRPPELIVQDELHLISGPLGTISGLFENIIELMCCRDGVTPKIIASTATINNATAQVEKLYGNRKAFSFPPPGLNFSDNFFAVVEKDDPTREYVGVYPTGKTFITMQIRLLSLLLYSRWNLFGKGFNDVDNYWSIVSYHNSLRELGRIVNKTGDEIEHSYRMLINRDFPGRSSRKRINYRELTSRISGYAIKSVLASVSKQNINLRDLDTSIANSIDLVFATNMISVGLDIDRFNLILVNGQPRSISEYVQVTSRIARRHPGLVVSAYNPMRIRDKSHFESFGLFHDSYYRFIEPVSITPFTKAAIDRMSATILAAYVRTKIEIENARDINERDLDGFYEFFYNRIKDRDMFNYLYEKIQAHLKYARDKLEVEPLARIGTDLMIRYNEVGMGQDNRGEWVAMDSMRDIGSSTVLKVRIPKKK